MSFDILDPSKMMVKMSKQVIISDLVNRVRIVSLSQCARLSCRSVNSCGSSIIQRLILTSRNHSCATSFGSTWRLPVALSRAEQGIYRMTSQYASCVALIPPVIIYNNYVLFFTIYYNLLFKDYWTIFVKVIVSSSLVQVHWYKVIGSRS